ncbi:MAG: ComF family protein [Rhizobiales bacterium]|nr:ComF family protein [Hyphomicrobiales bacterium]
MHIVHEQTIRSETTLARLGGGVHAFARTIADFVLPPQCPVCRAIINEQGHLCPECWMTLDLVEAPVCDRLGIPFALPALPGTVSAGAQAAPPVFAHARSAVLYNDPARQLVHGLKYRDRSDYALPMARMMFRAGQEMLDGADIIMPVPLHVRRLWSRRFNQSLQLAAHIARFANVPLMYDGLSRTRATPQQVGLSDTQRKRNVANAFNVPDRHVPMIRGRRVILVDDVLTTGATANAASRALLRAGAINVDVLVFAQVAEILQAAI